jgi:hypothetical protein
MPPPQFLLLVAMLLPLPRRKLRKSPQCSVVYSVNLNLKRQKKRFLMLLLPLLLLLLLLSPNPPKKMIRRFLAA